MPKTVNGVLYKSNKTRGIPTIHDRAGDSWLRVPCAMCIEEVLIMKRFESYDLNRAVYYPGSQPTPLYADADTVLVFCTDICRELYLLAPVLLEMPK